MMFHQWIDIVELDQRLDPYRYSPVFATALKNLKRCPYPLVTIQDVQVPGTPINYGILQPRAFLAEGGVPMVRAVDLANPFIEKQNVVCVPPIVEQAYTRSRLKPADVLVSIAGTLGAIGISPNGWSVVNINQSVARIRVTEPYDPYFLAIYLMSPTGQLLLVREAVGSVQRHLNLEDIPNVMLPLPEPGIQLAIGNKVRGAERLREMANKSLGNAKELLRSGLRLPELVGPESSPSWIQGHHIEFLRLDPEYYQPQYLRLDRYFERTKDSAWGCSQLVDIMLDCGYGVLPPSEVYGTGELRFIRAQDLGQYVIDMTQLISVPAVYANPKAIARTGDLLLEVKGELAGGAICPASADGSLLNGSIFRMRLDESVNPYYVLAVLLSPIGLMQKNRASANSIINYLSVDFLKAIRIPRLGVDYENEIGKSIMTYSELMMKARSMVESAMHEVESLIGGTLDREQLLVEGEQLARWLEAHPSTSP